MKGRSHFNEQCCGDKVAIDKELLTVAECTGGDVTGILNLLGENAIHSLVRR